MQKIQTAKVSPFGTYLPNPQTIPNQLRQQFKTLTAYESRGGLKELYKLYKKLLLNPDSVAQQTVILDYLQLPILAEFVLGNLELRFQALIVVKTLKSLKSQHLEEVLSKIDGENFDHLRNVSEILELLTNEQKQAPYIREKFVAPLLACFRNGVAKIEAENFSSKWLEGFMELARSTNNALKAQVVPNNQKQELYKLTQVAVQHILVLRRDVMTQIYLILLSINAEEPEPQQVLNKTHYFYAKSVTYNTPILTQLLKYTTIPDTQAKYHLLYALNLSFATEYVTYPNKSEEIFRRVAELFTVGRAGYGNLEDIVKTIVKNQGSWVIEGHLPKKFFFAKCVMQSYEGLQGCDAVLAAWPTLLQDSIRECGNMNTPFAIECVELLLTRWKAQLTEQRNHEWLAKWIQPYQKHLLEGSKATVRGIIEFVNPLITRICKAPLLFRHLLQLNSTPLANNPNLQLAIISTLKCYRQNGLILPDPNLANPGYEYKGHPDIRLNPKELRNLLLSNDTNIASKAFEFLVICQKQSDPVVPFEFDLVMDFAKNGLVTSSSEYRKTYLYNFHRLFERLRIVYQRELVPQESLKPTTSNTTSNLKKQKNKEHFESFKNFIVNLANLCFQTIYPQVPFEIVNPVLELLTIIFNFFGVYGYEIRKGTSFKGTSLFEGLQIYNPSNFSSLLLCLQCSFQNVRSLAYNLILQFPKTFESNIQTLWEDCVKGTNRLVIRQFESAARLICFIFDRYSHQLTSIEQTHTLKELNLFHYLLKVMRQRFNFFKQEFINQPAAFFDNFVHGLCNCYYYLFQQFTKKYAQDPALFEAHSKEIKQFFAELFQLQESILKFAVNISSASISTVILDNSGKDNSEGSTPQLKIDCRGHFIKQPVDQAKTEFVKNIQKMLSGSSILGGNQDENTDGNSSGTDSSLVGSFYLLTRQSGLMFQGLAGIVEVDPHQHFISEQSLLKIVNTYFYALVNLKHMGSVDRISRGLQRMAKAIYKLESTSLSQLPEKLLLKLLQLLEKSKFTNILRRSAGVPFAFTCLLKSQALRRKHLVEQTMNKLFSFAKNEDLSSKQIRIHSLNILKKLFQDSDLRFDLDAYVSEAFMLSIKGFNTEEWGVRNSALMLFSSLSLRTLGASPQLNLVQFFQRCPPLINFFMQELKKYVKSKTDTMYPPIYPIALLLSRLVPFEDNLFSSTTQNQQMFGEDCKLVKREDLQPFIPLLIEAGDTPNYMGRVMIGKVLLPFLDTGSILQFSSSLLQKTVFNGTKHNQLHSQTLIVYYLVRSYYKIQKKKQTDTEVERPILDGQKHLFSVLDQKFKSLDKLNCPLVQQMLIKIACKFCKHAGRHFKKSQLGALYDNFIQEFRKFAVGYLSTNLYSLPNFRFKQDLGHSIYRLAVVKLLLRISGAGMLDKNDFEPYTTFFAHLLAQSKADSLYLRRVDSQIILVYLAELRRLCKKYKTTPASLDQLRLSVESSFQQLIYHNFEPSVLADLLVVVRKLRIQDTKDQLQYLSKKQQTKNTPLRIAVFKLIAKQRYQVQTLLDKFSKPEELVVFRATVAKSIKEFQPEHIPIYIRLLEDQDSEIRKFTADRLASVLNQAALNQHVMKAQMLELLNKLSIQETIVRGGDLDIKKKNATEERIFSYDKPNKFRSDIQTYISLVSSKVSEVQGALKNFGDLNDIAKEYRKSVFNRNEVKKIINPSHIPNSTTLFLFLYPFLVQI